MFTRAYFPADYYAPVYFPDVGGVSPTPTPEDFGVRHRPFRAFVAPIAGYADLELPIPVLAVLGYSTPANTEGAWAGILPILDWSVEGQMVPATLSAVVGMGLPVTTLKATGIASPAVKKPRMEDEDELLEQYLRTTD